MNNPDMTPRPMIRATSILLDTGRICLVKQEVSEKRQWSLPGGKLELRENYLNVFHESLKKRPALMFESENYCILPTG